MERDCSCLVAAGAHLGALESYHSGSLNGRPFPQNDAELRTYFTPCYTWRTGHPLHPLEFLLSNRKTALQDMLALMLQ